MTDLYHNLSSSHFFVTGTLRGLSEFDGADTATICYMHQLELLVPVMYVSAIVSARNAG